MSEYGLKSQEESLVVRVLKSPLFWFLSAAVVLTSTLAIRKLSGPELPTEPLSHVPSFQFQDQSGAPFTDANFLGKTSIVNFIFTSCPDVCPLLTAKMKELQSKAQMRGLDLQFVSISVDPNTDTPDVLRQYGQVHKVDHRNWAFVTGPLDQIQSVIVDSFKVAVERGQSGGKGAPSGEANVESLMEITHGEQFALVDKEGQIRAYRRGDQSASLEELLELAARAAN